MIQVTITKDDDGNFTVAQGDTAQDSAQGQGVQSSMPDQSPMAKGQPAPDADMDTDGTKGQPAKDMKSALLMAAQMLMSDNTESAYDKAFSSGMARNNPGSYGGQQ